MTLNPTLHEQYSTLRSSEGVWLSVLALIPFVGRRLESDLFLESVREVNQLIPEMKEAGLIKDCDFIDSFRDLGDRMGASSVCRFWEVSLSDLGLLVMNEIRELNG